MMAGDTVVMVRAGEALIAVVTTFTRVPVPGELVLLWLTETQRGQLGAEYGFGNAKLCVPAIVRETVLRQEDHWSANLPGRWSPSVTIENHVADLFADAITNDAWRTRMTRWVSGGDES